MENCEVFGVQGNVARLTRILVKVLTTTQLADAFGLGSSINAKSELPKIDEIICPRWMKKCRMEGVSKGDIKIIIVKLAKTDKEFGKISV